jgi:tetratricopeptide (TPR) repeat protein
MFAYTLRLIGFVCACGLSLVAANLDREIVLAPHAGLRPEDAEIIRWQDRARGKNASADVFERLARSYVAKARRTLDAGFYKLAEKTVDVIDAHYGVTPESRLLRGHVLHNVHRFGEAEAIARQLVTERGQPEDFALLSDALVEQGKLAEGITALQRMVELKPGVEAYSRIAHVRWLKGDLAGAMAAMESALVTSNARDAETRGWLLTRLSGFHLQRGDATRALKLADDALERIAMYPAALLARGRALIALGKITESIEPLQQAEKLQPLPDYQWWLTDALAAVGRRAEADVVERRLVARGAETDARTLAVFLATRGNQPAEAVRLARAELTERRDVFSRDAFAWALFATGETEAANEELRGLLVEGTKDARLLLHAGEISRVRGEVAAAAEFFAAAASAAGTLTPSERALLANRTARADGIAAR